MRFFGDVEFGHHFDARSQLAAHGDRRLNNFAQLPVHTETDACGVFVKFEMDIRCAGIQSVGQGFLDKPRNRPVFRFLIVDEQSLRRSGIQLFLRHSRKIVVERCASHSVSVKS